MTSTTLFTPAASVSVNPVPWGPQTFAMPAVDGANLDLVVANSGGSIAWMQFAANAPAGPNMPGVITVQPGPQALIAQTATALSAMSGSTGAVLTITRGTALAQRGISLIAGANGALLARPAALLTEADKAVLRQHKAEIVALLAEAEEVA